MRKIIVIAALVAAFFASTAQAGNPSLCRSWQVAQSASGEAFSSRQECARGKEVYLPSVTITPNTVSAGENFTIAGSGFHPGSVMIVSWAITGEPPYHEEGDFLFDANGYSIYGVAFPECEETSTSYTVSVRDYEGVHASAIVTLC